MRHLDRSIGVEYAEWIADELDCAFVMLGKGLFSLIDKDDLERANAFHWCIHSRGYAQMTITKIYLHRFVMPPVPDGCELDHINLNKLDNRKGNLRVATVSQNRANSIIRSHNKSSRFKGVRLDRRNNLGRYHARTTLNGKDVHIGTFHTEVEAAKAYNEWALKTFGEFARPNQIPQCQP
jgi:hypothetical protein